MKVTFADEAEADLEDIGDRIALDNPARAFSFVRELRQRCEMLSNSPEAFPVIRYRRGTPLRRRPYRRYLIFYEVRDRDVLVVRILHGARDYGPLIA